MRCVIKLISCVLLTQLILCQSEGVIYEDDSEKQQVQHAPGTDHKAQASEAKEPDREFDLINAIIQDDRRNRCPTWRRDCY